MSDHQQVAAYLRYVHEHAIAAGSDGRIIVSRDNPGRNPRYTSKAYRLAELSDAATAVETISATGANAFVRVSLLARDLERSSERGPASATGTVTHFAGDVDIAGPGHAETNLPSTIDEAVALIDATLPPSLIVASGGGLYPIWRLAEPVDVTDPSQRERVTEIGARLDIALNGHGFHVDAVCKDMARIIRPPGAVNYKPGREPRLVTVHRGCAYGAGDYVLDELDTLLPPHSTTGPRHAVESDRPLRTSHGTPTGLDGKTAPWVIADEWYTVDEILAIDRVDRWERVADQSFGGLAVPAWRRVGSSAEYSIKIAPSGAIIVWSASLAARLGKNSGDGIDKWGLLCAFAERDPAEAARWSS